MILNLNPIKHFLLNRLSMQAIKIIRNYGLFCVGCFVGVLYTGNMTVKTFKSAIFKLRRLNISVAEVLFHPANIDCSEDMKEKGLRIPEYYYLKERCMEKKNLLSDKSFRNQ